MNTMQHLGIKAMGLACAAILLSSCATTSSNKEKTEVWFEDSMLIASDATAGAGFGGAISLKGDTAIIGAWQDDVGGVDSGSAYIFVRNGDGWIEQQKLIASDAEAEDTFGGQVSIDGDTAIVGSALDDDTFPQAGSAYVFVRNGGVWTQQAKLTASDASAQVAFGSSVSISGDTAIVGAEFGNSGSAYVFVRNGTTWTQQAKLTADDAETIIMFGVSVSLSGDTAVIGSFSGSAFVFTRKGAEWTQQAKLIAKGDAGGSRVSLDGDTAIVSAWQDSSKIKSAGSVYVYMRSGGVWTQEAKLTADDANTFDEFGSSVSIQGDTAVIGAFSAGSCNDTCHPSGSAYVFTRSGGVWRQQTTLTSSDKAKGDLFGQGVAISGDTVMVGANGVKTAGDYSGAAYVFDLAKPKP
jgi:hypothetical protein